MVSQADAQKKPPQTQEQQPVREFRMSPLPSYDPKYYRGSGKLQDVVAIVTGGDSGIGRAISVLFAREGACVVIVYLEEDVDAQKTKELVEDEQSEALLVKGDLVEKAFCESVVHQTIQRFGKVDVLVNNAAEQHPTENILDITESQLRRTFETNIFSYFFMSQAVLPHLSSGSTIINTTSVTAYRGSHHLIDYSATKGAIVAFTRSLSKALADQGIRVNAVAPGPIWTPLIPSTFSAEHVAEFGTSVPLGRPGQPKEVAPCYVFLASRDSSYMTGQVLHPNGGEVVNG